ncbi:hypothetical protein JST97_22630 [bacterium]|nr:hypothetical protein [bacterium]
MNTGPIGGPDRFGPQEKNYLTPPPQLGASLERLQDPQVHQALLPIIQMQQKNAAMLMQMMQILSTLMGNQEAVQATSAETQTGNFEHHSDVLDGSEAHLAAGELGQRLAQAAENNALMVNTPGLALGEVSKVLREFGFRLGNHTGCFQLVSDMRASPLVQEVQLPRSELVHLPAGVIVVWDKAPGLQSGHVSIALGDGREASSLVCEQMQFNANHWAFYPKCK